MLNNLTLLTYTHSSVADLHKPYFGRIKKFFPGLQHSVVTCNTPVEVGDVEWVPYSDLYRHSHHMITALDHITTEYVLYSQEDYILYDYVQEDKLLEYMEVLAEGNLVHFVRLIKSGVGQSRAVYNEELAFVDPYENPYFFSTQATIWRRDVLRAMYLKSNVNSIFDETQNSSALAGLGAHGVYTIKVGSQVGGHYNSLVYPYIATAKVKGRWNLAEYSKEIRQLANEYNLQIV